MFRGFSTGRGLSVAELQAAGHGDVDAGAEGGVGGEEEAQQPDLLRRPEPLQRLQQSVVQSLVRDAPQLLKSIFGTKGATK